MQRARYRDLYSIGKIASKHGMQLEQLVENMVKATENKSVNCGKLNVSCIRSDNKSASFLITEGDKVVWQASVSLEAITNMGTIGYVNSILESEKKVDCVERKLDIGDLRIGMKGACVKGEITNIPPARLVNTKWGSQALVSDVKITDKTGSIKLSLWNNQIESVRVGDEVELTNCTVAKYLEEPQLRIARKGTLSVNNQKQRVVALSPVMF